MRDRQVRFEDHSESEAGPSMTNLQTSQARMPPMTGATMKIHRGPSPSLLNRASPMDLAGLTKVPVRLIPTMCTMVRARLI